MLQFEGLFGVVGSLVEQLVLKKHMVGLLLRRNQCVLRVAESEEWRRYFL